MSVHAGSILTVAGNNVIDRIQSAGLGNPNIPVDTIREVGNALVVDKIPGDPDFTFTMESLDTSTDLMALLTGKVGAVAEPGGAPGAADPPGTRYRWSDVRPINICSPWKDPAQDAAGTIVAGHLVPGYYPTRVRYRFGVTDNATQEVELSGGAYYYAGRPPVEEYATGDGSTTAFVTSAGAVAHRKGGAGGTTFRHVFGVMVGQDVMVEGADFIVTGGAGAAPYSPVTLTFFRAPGAGELVRWTYFTAADKAYPQPVHASTVVKPGAVRGRNIQLFLGAGGARQRIGSVQSIELEATVEGEAQREMGSEEVTGRVVNGTDCSGTVTVRSRSYQDFLALLSKITGVAAGEVIGFLNQNAVPMEVPIENPKNPGQILKTLFVEEAIFQVPGTPARVNAPTDFALPFQAKDGTFSEFKGAKPG